MILFAAIINGVIMNHNIHYMQSIWLLKNKIIITSASLNSAVLSTVIMDMETGYLKLEG